MTITRSIAHAVSQLLLPISQDNFYRAWERAQYVLADLSLPSEEERGDYLSFEIQKWRETRSPSRILRSVVEECLSAEEIFGTRFRKSYFETHAKLISSGNLSFENASALLSHANLIAQLLTVDHLSCAQIASLLSARRGGFEYNWNQLQIVAKSLDSFPAVDGTRLLKQSQEDVDAAYDMFADASPENCIPVIVEIGQQLGYPGDLNATLSQFLPSLEEFVPAYAVIVNTNLLIVSDYDHPVSAAYEFTPRGDVAKKLQHDRHPSYTATESAYLNNSKGAFAFDRNWAWSRKPGIRSQALAMADLFSGLNQMAYPARRELSRWIRSWLMKIEDSFRQNQVPVISADFEGISRFFESLSSGNTGTFGVLEQRAVDFLSAVLLDSQEPEYEVRGRGDSVSASNTSRLKFGDIEYKSNDKRSIIAFEAHGGHLSEFYIDIHVASLRRILPRRELELKQAAAPADWDFEVKFVAHDLTGMNSGAQTHDIEGFRVRLSAMSFRELWNQVMGSVESRIIVDKFETIVTSQIFSRWVPRETKKVFTQMISL